MTAGPAIAAEGLGKSFGPRRVLAGIDLEVPRGSVFALLGPNGAGKTTTVRILATLLRPDEGCARVTGLDVVTDRHRVRRAISLTGQYAAVDEVQTGQENLQMMGRLAGLSRSGARLRADELIDQLDLADAARRRVATYSGGLRRRLDLAAGLVGRPQVIFLDEPTTGLDPRARQGIWRLVAELVRDGVTIFLTTQYLEEADQLADRIAVIDDGRVVADGTAAQLKAQVSAQRLDLTVTDRETFAALLSRLGAQVVHRVDEELLLGVATDGSAQQIRAVMDAVDPDRVAVQHFSVHQATLDDVFLTLTGHGAGSTGASGPGEPADLSDEKEPIHV